MFELLVIVLFGWLSVKAIGLMLKLTWCTAKVLSVLLVGLALPVLVFCLLFAGGVVLLLPLAMLGGVVGVLRACT